MATMAIFRYGHSLISSQNPIVLFISLDNGRTDMAGCPVVLSSIRGYLQGVPYHLTVHMECSDNDLRAFWRLSSAPSQRPTVGILLCSSAECQRITLAHQLLRQKEATVSFLQHVGAPRNDASFHLPRGFPLSMPGCGTSPSGRRVCGDKTGFNVMAPRFGQDVLPSSLFQDMGVGQGPRPWFGASCLGACATSLRSGTGCYSSPFAGQWE